MENMNYSYFESPVGKLLLTGNNLLENLYFPLGKKRIEPEKGWKHTPEKFMDAFFQLEAYFKGELIRFDLELSVNGTNFQKKVWKELVNIPYGETIAYGELAKRVGNPNASRAVGMATGKNPVPIIIPCHRVIGKNGSLTGFGGGLNVKKRLLELEKRYKK